MRSTLTNVLAALSALAAAGTLSPADAAPALRFGPHAPPGYHRTELLTVKLERRNTTERGWKRCSPSMPADTTAAPVLTFELDQAMPLRIRLEAPSGLPLGGGNGAAGAVLVTPDRGYVCDDAKNQFYMKPWPKGRYELYLTSNASQLKAHVVFDDPDATRAALAAALDKLPVVTLGEAAAGAGAAPAAIAPQNPRYLRVPATVAADGREAGPTCVDPPLRVAPVAKLEVARAGAWYVGAPGANLYVLTANQKCLRPSNKPGLPAGTHTLWAAVPRDASPAPLELELDDRDASVVFPPAERRDAGALATPLTLTGRVRPGERWYTRRGACRGVARAPDFYVRADKLLQRVSMWLLWAPVKQRLHVYGPLERPPASGEVSCDTGDASHAFDIFEGTYAVWIGSDDTAAAPGSTYRLVVQRDDAPVDALTTFVAIPETLSLADRAIEHHYPYFRNRPITDWTRLLTTVPERMFVYTRAPASSGADDVPEGEPLLVAWSHDDRTTAYRLDGRKVTLDTRLVSPARPAKVALPTRPTVPELTDFVEARRASAPEDEQLFAKHDGLREKYAVCMTAYLEKHDPTWGHKHELYRIGRGRVVNVGDEVAAAGSRTCGGAALAASEQSLIKRLAQRRATHYAANLAAARKRFGL